MRYKEIKTPDSVLCCDICFKSDIETMTPHGEFEKFWNDFEDEIIVCDTCKKQEESK